MKKIISTSLIAIGLLFAAGTSNTNKINYLPKKEVISLLKNLPDGGKKLIEDYQSGRIKVYIEPKADFYIVIIKGQRRGEFFITKDKKYAIFGSVLDLKNKKPIVGDLPPVDKKIIEKGVAFTYGVGDKDIYLVTDPQCPYCRMLENKKGDMLNEKYRVHVILYPLPFHRYAKPMTEYILAGKTDKERAERLRRILHGSNEWKDFHPAPKQRETIEKKMKAMEKAVNELGAQGTPTIYNKDFKQIPLREIYQQK